MVRLAFLLLVFALFQGFPCSCLCTNHIFKILRTVYRIVMHRCCWDPRSNKEFFFKVSIKPREYPFYVFDKIIKNYGQCVCDGGGGFSHSVLSDSFVTPWTVACQAPLSMAFSRQEHWNGLPFPSSEDLPDLEIKPVSSALLAELFTTEPPGNLVCNGTKGCFSVLIYYRNIVKYHRLNHNLYLLLSNPGGCWRIYRWNNWR